MNKTAVARELVSVAKELVGETVPMDPAEVRATAKKLEITLDNAVADFLNHHMSDLNKYIAKAEEAAIEAEGMHVRDFISSSKQVSVMSKAAMEWFQDHV